MFASLNGHTGVVKELLSGGANINATASGGWTAFFVASQNGHTAVVKELLLGRADVHCVAKDGQTALTVAEQPELIACLLAHGALWPSEDPAL
jgi:ankyrin repeat protein